MSDLAAAVAAIRTGEVVGVPTDTVYGLAADPWNQTAVARLFELKGRPSNKPIGLLAASVGQVGEIADLSSAGSFATEHWPGALTLVLTPLVVIPDWMGTESVDTIGVRVPDHDILRRLLDETGPLAVTSCNIAGGDEALDDDGARALFGPEIGIYVAGDSPGGVASTVVDATGTEPVVLREGPVRFGRPRPG